MAAPTTAICTRLRLLVLWLAVAALACATCTAEAGSGHHHGHHAPAPPPDDTTPSSQCAAFDCFPSTAFCCGDPIRCVDGQTDNDNCGGCGISCKNLPGIIASTCVDGKCVPNI